MVVPCLYGLPHGVVIEQWLSHSHQHDVGHAATLVVPARKVQDLVHDLGRVEVTHKAALPGGAKGASDGTAHL